MSDKDKDEARAAFNESLVENQRTIIRSLLLHDDLLRMRLRLALKVCWLLVAIVLVLAWQILKP